MIWGVFGCKWRAEREKKMHIRNSRKINSHNKLHFITRQKKKETFSFSVLRLAPSPPMCTHTCSGVWLSLMCNTGETEVSVRQINRQADGNEVSQRFTHKYQYKCRHKPRQSCFISWHLGSSFSEIKRDEDRRRQIEERSWEEWGARSIREAKRV